MAGTNVRGNRVCLVVDTEGHGFLAESMQARQLYALSVLHDAAASTAGLNPESWYRQAAGDGLLAVLPEDADAGRVLAGFTEGLGVALREYNASALPAARLRLRVALAWGPASRGKDGWIGKGLVAASRLADAVPVREALARFPDADLVVAAGESLYGDAVRRQLPGVRPEEWTRVRIDVKGFDGMAYVAVPGRLASASLAETGNVPGLSGRGREPTGGSRWFVSAPGGTDLRPLLAGLEERGVTPYVASDVARLGESILESLRAAILAADRVLVVLPEAGQSLNPAFEAGMAAALRKPVAVIAPPGVVMPSDLAGFLVVRARPDELGAVHFALDQAEAWVPATTLPVSAQVDIRWQVTGEPAPSAASGGALGARADDLLARTDKIRTLGSTPAATQAFVDILVEAIEGSRAVAVQNATDHGYDLGVWSDDLDAIAANPLLIEVKTSLSRNAVRQAAQMAQAHPSARTVLLVYLDQLETDPAVLSEARLPVLAVSFGELLTRMRDTSFAEVVRQLRNQSVHGAATG